MLNRSLPEYFANAIAAFCKALHSRRSHLLITDACFIGLWRFPLGTETEPHSLNGFNPIAAQLLA